MRLSAVVTTSVVLGLLETTKVITTAERSPNLQPLARLDGLGLEGGVDNLVGRDTFGLAFKVENQAMAQGGASRLLNILKADVVTPTEQRGDLCSQDQGLETTRAGAV